MNCLKITKLLSPTKLVLYIFSPDIQELLLARILSHLNLLLLICPHTLLHPQIYCVFTDLFCLLHLVQPFFVFLSNVFSFLYFLFFLDLELWITRYFFNKRFFQENRFISQDYHNLFFLCSFKERIFNDNTVSVWNFWLEDCIVTDKRSATRNDCACSFKWLIRDNFIFSFQFLVKYFLDLLLFLSLIGSFRLMGMNQVWLRSWFKF